MSRVTRLVTISGALGHKALGLTGHSRPKAQRLLSTRRPTSIPEHSLAELKPPKPDSASLSETIRLAQQGDAAAFELIYRLHCGRVYALCLRMLREPVEAEDLAQDVFLQLFRKIHTFRGESAFSSWLHRLTANLVLMRLRRKRPMSTSLDEIKSDEEDSGRSDEIGGPDLHLSGLFDRLNLQAAIDQLPMGFKAMFILHDVHGYEHGEIAKILGCSVGNSKSQLHKARKRLRELLQKVQYGGEQNPQPPTTLSGSSPATSLGGRWLDLRETRTGRSMKRTAITPRVLLAPLIFLLPFGVAILNFPTSVTAQSLVSDDVKHDTPGQLIEPGESLRVDVDLALVNVTVTDPYRRLVTGLEPDNFRIFEDNVEQEVVNFSSEDVPISIGVILDHSGSMTNKLGKAKEAAFQFFKTANPEDEFFLVGFNEHSELLSPFTNNVEDLQSRMLPASAKGRTALLDAIYLGLSEMRRARNGKRALLIISDGGDNSSRYNEKDIKRLVREADTQLYSIGIFDPLDDRNRTPEELHGPSLLNEMAELTGGRAFTVENLNDLPDIAAKIGMELRNQYILGYHPSNKAHDARWRKIKIKLRAPKGLPPLSVYAKTGYYAPNL